MAHSAPGRHRAAGRPNPLNELASVRSRPGLKASAVLAASGGLVAAVVSPAVAEPSPSPALIGPQAVTASFGVTGFEGTAAPDSGTDADAATAVVAPTTTTTPTETTTFGITGFTATARPKPKRMDSRATAVSITSAGQRVDTTVSRSTMRGTNPNSTTSQGVASTQTRTATGTSVTVKQPTAPTSTTSSIGSQIVSVARSLLGIYYVYGGTTPAGFDCSGFTQYVYKKVGISIPRTASQQQAAATRVSSPQPGDLVFFGYPAYHVGIYTKPGYMIDSPRSGKATSERAIWSSSATYGRLR